MINWEDAKMSKYRLIFIILVIIALPGILYLLIHLGVPLEEPAPPDAHFTIPEDLDDEETGISVMSYNIRLINNEEQEEHYWTNRKEHLSNLIIDYRPDIIGFQEVTHPQYKFLIEQLGDYYAFYGIYRSGMNRERGNILISDIDPEPTFLNRLRIALVDEGSPIFFNKSRFELLERKTFWLNENPEKPGRGWDAAIKRICTVVRLKDHYTDEILEVYNTHFDHRGTKAQQKSAELISEKVMQSSEKAIVMGDFNVAEGGEVYNYLVEETLSDSKYLSPHQNRDEGPTFNGFGNYRYEKPIDYIFVTANTLSASEYQIINKRYNNNYYISDHYPVLAKLKYK